MKVWSIAVGGAVGLVFTILPVLFPKQQKYLPSASGFGLAWIFQWYYGVLFFIGAVIAWWFEKKSPAKAEEFTFPVASGVIAGGALMGVAIIFWQNWNWNVAQILWALTGPARAWPLTQSLNRVKIAAKSLLPSPFF